MAFSIRTYTQSFYSEWEIEISAVVNGKLGLIVQRLRWTSSRTTAFAKS
jgi:hypothetical protein